MVSHKSKKFARYLDKVLRLSDDLSTTEVIFQSPPDEPPYSPWDFSITSLVSRGDHLFSNRSKGAGRTDLYLSNGTSAGTRIIVFPVEATIRENLKAPSDIFATSLNYYLLMETIEGPMLFAMPRNVPNASLRRISLPYTALLWDELPFAVHRDKLRTVFTKDRIVGNHATGFWSFDEREGHLAPVEIGQQGEL